MTRRRFLAPLLLTAVGCGGPAFFASETLWHDASSDTSPDTDRTPADASSVDDVPSFDTWSPASAEAASPGDAASSAEADASAPPTDASASTDASTPMDATPVLDTGAAVDTGSVDTAVPCPVYPDCTQSANVSCGAQYNQFSCPNEGVGVVCCFK